MKRLALTGLCAMSLALAACGGASAGGGDGSSTPATAGKGGGLVGSPAPEFELAKAGGGNVSLASLKGKVVIVDFWATWCEPCKKSFPKYQELYVKYKDRVEIVAVSVDEENEGIEAFGKSHGEVEFPLLWGESSQDVAKKYGVEKMPTAYLIDKEGVVRFVHKEFHDGDEAQIERDLKSLF